MCDGRIRCRFETNFRGLCPVPRTLSLSPNKRSGGNVDYCSQIPKDGLRYEWPKGVMRTIRTNPICKMCELVKGIEKVLEEGTGDFCQECIPIAREWSVSWCWCVGEPGNRFPNGQCSQYIDNGQFLWIQGACALHDQFQHDSKGNIVLHEGGQHARQEEFKRDDKGEFVLEGGRQVVRNGIIRMEGGSKVQIRKLWPETLDPRQHSGAWYLGREAFSGSVDYPPEYLWPDYTGIPWYPELNTE